jgi:hypothetical protein
MDNNSELNESRTNIHSLQIGNVGDLVGFKFKTEEGEMILQFGIEQARETARLIYEVIEKIEAEGYKDDIDGTID